MKSDIQYGSSDKRDWVANHTLSKEQVAKLIQNKFERAKKDQERQHQLRELVKFTD